MAKRKKKDLFCRPPRPLKARIALTTGAASGIGKEIAKASLKRLGPQKNFQFLIWSDKKSETLKAPPFQTLVFDSAKKALQSPFKESRLLQIKRGGGAGDWLEEAGRLCLKKELSALITGPAGKKEIKKNRLKALSQTALLKKLSRAPQVFMGFRGRLFNIVLLTDHIPLKKVSIDKKALAECLRLALKARRFLSPSKQKKPIGLLGLNPHSGEGGLIGSEEKRIIAAVLKKFSSKEVEGPLCPDSAFLKKNWALYSFFAALYHDQGLIPFKMAHSHTGFAHSLGLPFLRLGVDHGTGEGLKPRAASCKSFLNALKEALKIVRSGDF